MKSPTNPIPAASVRALVLPAVRVAVTAACLLATVSAVQGATRHWNGSYSIYWSAPLNWDEGVVPADGDYLVFPAGASRLSNYNNIGGLNLQSIQFTGGGYTLQGNSIGLDGFIQVTVSGVANTVDMDVNLDDSLLLAVGYATSSLDINGNINLGGYTLSVAGGGPIDLSGVISGTGGITKDGICTLTLSGSTENTYSGETRVLAGTMQLAKTVSDGAIHYGTLTIGNGSGGDDTAIVRELDDYQIGSIPITINEDGWLDVGDYYDTVGAITLNGGRAGGSATGTLALGGTVTVNASAEEASIVGKLNLYSTSRTFDVANGSAGYDLRVSAIVTGGGLVKTGAGLMALQGANTYTGTTTVNVGRLYVLNNNGLGDTAGGTVIGSSGFIQLVNVDIGPEPLALGRTDSGSVLFATGTCSWSGDVVLNEDSSMGTSGSMEFSGAISGAGGIRITSGGSFTFSGTTANTYAGDTQVLDGTLFLDKQTTDGALSGPGDLYVGDGVSAVDSIVVQWLRDYQVDEDVTITAIPSGKVDLNNHSDTVGPLVLNAGRIYTGTGTMMLYGDVTAQFVEGVGSPYIFGNMSLGSSTRTFTVTGSGLYIYAVVSGAGGLTKEGSGELILIANNTYNGTTTVNDGRLELEIGTALGSTAAGTIVNEGAYLGMGLSCDVGNESLTLAGSLVTPYPGSLCSWAGPITLEGDPIVELSSLSQLNLSGVIGGSGSLNIEAPGGFLTLSGSSANTYGGSTYLNAGYLKMSKTSGNAIPHTLFVGIGSGAEHGAIAWNLQSAQCDIVVVNATGLYDLNGHNETLGSLTLNGGGDVETGAGTLTLATASPLVVDPGSVTDASAQISGHLNVGTGQRVLDVGQGLASSGNPSDLLIDAELSGSAEIIKEGDGELQLSGANTFTGPFTLNAGALRLDNDLGLGTTAAGIAVNNHTYLQLHGGGHNILGEPLTLNSSYHGWGTLYSTSGTNSWTGDITLQSGAWIGVGTADGLLNLGGVIMGSGSLTKANQGTVRLSGSSGNTYTGDTYVNEGVLELGKSGLVEAISAGSLTIGDGAGGIAADVVREMFNHQIGDLPVRINDSGLLDLNNHMDYLTGLTFDGGRVTTGTGQLALAGDVTVLTNDVHAARIEGRVWLPDVREFNVQNTPVFYPDLAMYATVEGPGGIEKTGEGSLLLYYSNTYEGKTLVNEGVLGVYDSTALGDDATGTAVESGAALIVNNNSHVPYESLRLSGTGFGAYGALDSFIGSNSWAGDIVIALDTRIRVLDATDTLNLSGSISGSAGFTKVGNGVLILSGSTGNSNTGDTHVDGGTLLLDKTIANNTIMGDLFIGDGIGGADADVVRLANGPEIANVRITIASSGLFDMNDHSEYFGSLAGSGHVTMGTGTLSAGADNTSTAFSGLIEGTGTVRKYGIGTMTLSGNNTYTGPTEVNFGTLLVHGSQPASDVTISPSGQLGGTGTVGNIESAGVVAPGASPGVLHATGAQLASGSTFAIELNGHIAGSGYDQLAVKGTNDVTGAALAVSLGYLPAVGDSFVILNNDGTDAVSGTFAGLPDGASLSVSNAMLVIDYAGGTGNDVVLTVTNVTAVEPLRFTSIVKAGTNVVLTWAGGVPFYIVEKKSALTNATWQSITPPMRELHTNAPMDVHDGFYRVRGWN